MLLFCADLHEPTKRALLETAPIPKSLSRASGDIQHPRCLWHAACTMRAHQANTAHDTLRMRLHMGDGVNLQASSCRPYQTSCDYWMGVPTWDGGGLEVGAVLGEEGSGEGGQAVVHLLHRLPRSQVGVHQQPACQGCLQPWPCPPTKCMTSTRQGGHARPLQTTYTAPLRHLQPQQGFPWERHGSHPIHLA